MKQVYNRGGPDASVNGRHSLHQIAGAVTNLEPFGSDWWRGDCPLCNDQEESFTVFPPQNGTGEEAFKCEHCGESGFAGDFIKLLYSEAPLEGRALTDMGNAERLVARHGGDLRYCYAWKKWLVWDGKRWHVDDGGATKERAKDTVRAMYDEAGKAQTEGERKAIAAHAVRSESRQRVEAMISLAESAVPVRADDLDPDPWALNVLNGTIDLSTGKLREHRREDMLTKIAPVKYDPEAKAPTFEAFLERILPSEALRRFVQRAVGYAAAGILSEEILTIFHGVGANGKSTLVNAIMDALGDYAIQAAPDLLLAKRGAHPTELADLFGARFVASVEVDEGRRLAESLVKQLTGRDRIKARKMREDFWEFSPTHTVFLATNHRPEVRGTDLAIWRRIKLVPFEATIPEGEQDKRLAEKLRKELPGILAWIVRGCLEYQREGLGEPEEVRAATEGYRSEMDVLAAFIEDRCVEHPRAKVGATPLYRAYKDWCEDAGENQLTQTKFGRRLKERGFRNEKVQTVTWPGIGLRDDRPDPGPDGGGNGGDQSPNPLNVDSSGPNRLADESRVDKGDSENSGRESRGFRPENDMNGLENAHEAVISEKGLNPLNHLLPSATDSLPDGAEQVRALLDDPPEWLADTLDRCREQPERYTRTTSSSIAHKELGTSTRWREVMPILEAWLDEQAG